MAPQCSVERMNDLGCDRNISTIRNPLGRVVLTVIELDP